MRPFIVAANWKMHKSPKETSAFFAEFVPEAKRALSESGGANSIVVFVPAIDMMAAADALKGAPIAFGAQNIYFETKGAFTGETSPAVVAEVGAKFALVGHSERRAIFHETDEETAKKVSAVQKVGLVPMLCVGESLQEREAGHTDQVIVRQLSVGLSQADLEKPLTIAYEPVWAIGTGKVATPEQAGAAHAVLRQALEEIGGKKLADITPILYGGSVKPENSAEIAKQTEVDGFLVGGASLEVSSFTALCRTQKS